MRPLAAGLALNRIAFGVGYLVAPGRTGRKWIGRAANKEATKVFTRALGARDLALGLGALRALAARRDAQAWFAAHAISDAADLAATLAARRALPEEGYRFALVMAAASTAVAVGGAVTLD